MFSSKSYMGLIIVLELASRKSDDLLTSADLADKYKTSRRYLEVVFNNLAKAGLIKSKRGIGGGYALNINLESTSLYDLVKAVEGRLGLFKSADYLVREGEQAGVIKAVNQFWDKQDKLIRKELDSQVLSRVISDLKSAKDMYHI